MPTYTIASGDDDGYDTGGSWLVNGDAGGLLPIGRYGGPFLTVGLRFQVDLASMPVDNVATLSIYLTGEQVGLPFVDIFADDADDSAALSGSALPSDRTYTTATVHIELTAAEWNTAGWQDIDVTDIVTEVLSRGGWEADNFLTIILTGNIGAPGSDYVYFRDFSNAGATPAQLTIAAGVPNAVIPDTSWNALNEAPETTSGAPEVPNADIPDAMWRALNEVPTAETFSASGSVSIAASDDDGWRDTAAFTNTSLWLGLGDNNEITTYLIFRSLAIPQGSVVSACLLDYYLSSHFNRPDLLVRGIAADDIDVIDATNILTLPRTEAVTAHDYSARPTGAQSVGDWASEVAGIGAVDIAAQLQEVVNRPGWVSGNDFAVVFECAADHPYAFAILNDYTNNPALVATIDYTLSTLPAVLSCTNPRPGLSFTATGLYLGDSTAATLSIGGVSVAQTITDVSATDVVMTCVEGNLPPGPLTLTITGGAAPAVFVVEKLPALATSDYVVMVSPYTDVSSVGYLMDPPLAEPDIIEWLDAENITLGSSGVWTGTETNSTIEFRRWIAETEEWDPEGWIVHTVVLGSAAIIPSTSWRALNQVPDTTGTVLAIIPNTSWNARNEVPTVAAIPQANIPDTAWRALNEAPETSADVVNAEIPDTSWRAANQVPSVSVVAPIFPVRRMLVWDENQTPDLVIGDTFHHLVTLYSGNAPFDVSAASSISATIVSADHSAEYAAGAIEMASESPGADWGSGDVILYMSGIETAGVAEFVRRETLVKIEVQVVIGADRFTWFGAARAIPGFIQ